MSVQDDLINAYEDIIHFPHHMSPNRPHMPAADRAAQFAPFAALTGYGDVIKETARRTDAAPELTEDERYVLETFYGEDNQYGSNAADDVADYFQIERASAYRRKNRALERLTILLFGKV